MFLNSSMLMVCLSAVMMLAPLAKADDFNATTTTTKAGLFVEPSITFEPGDTSVNYPSPLANSTGKAEGFGAAARVGFHLNEAFFLGLDLRYSMPQFKDSSVNYNAKATSTNWGPVVGFQMPHLGLRLWGASILGGELDPERSGSFDVKLQNANGYRVGAGFRIASVSLNLEYQDLIYKQATLEQIGPFVPGTTFNNVTLQNKSWIASLSFPLEL